MPFEIVACNVIISYWSTDVPTGAIIAIVIVLYGYVTSISPQFVNCCAEKKLILHQFDQYDGCQVVW